jgi:hypothetical protein
MVSRLPMKAEDNTDLSFILEILSLGLSVLGVLLTSFTTAFGGLLDALGTYNELKNPSGT